MPKKTNKQDNKINKKKPETKGDIPCDCVYEMSQTRKPTPQVEGSSQGREENGNLLSGYILELHRDEDHTTL